MSLAEGLAKLREEIRSQIPAGQYEAMVRATEDLAKSGIIESALKEGDFAPDFVLPNALSTQVSLVDLLEKGPVVLNFYRGGW